MIFRMKLRAAIGPVMGSVMLASVAAPAGAAEVRNVILMIGDGMGPQQVGLLETYANQAPDSIYDGEPTAFYQLAKEGVVGVSLTHPEDAVVVDSACSATQLASGIYSGSEVIGIDAEGNPVETVLELAKRRARQPAWSRTLA